MTQALQVRHDPFPTVERLPMTATHHYHRIPAGGTDKTD